MSTTKPQPEKLTETQKKNRGRREERKAIASLGAQHQEVERVAKLRKKATKRDLKDMQIAKGLRPAALHSHSTGCSLSQGL